MPQRQPADPPAAPPLARPATTHWEFPRSVAGIALLLDFAEEHGLQRAPLLAAAGLTEAVLADPHEVVPAQVELTLLDALRTALVDDESAALRLGERYHLTTFGVLGYALLSSGTVGEAMDLALRFLDLSHAFTVPEVCVDGDTVVVGLHAVDLPEPLVRFLVERDAAAIHTVLGELVDGGVPFHSVDFAFPGPRGSAHATVLGVEPRFDAPVSVLRLVAADLARPLPQGSPHSQVLAEQLCLGVASRRRGQGGAPEQVRLWITRNLPYLGDRGGMTSAAADLAMSERTLRRSLARAGTSYRELLDEVRQDLAEEMLATGVLSVEDVAQRLGYAEASSFIHAFKRWRGETPAQFRFRRARRAGRASAG